MLTAIQIKCTYPLWHFSGYFLLRCRISTMHLIYRCRIFEWKSALMFICSNDMREGRKQSKYRRFLKFRSLPYIVGSKIVRALEIIPVQKLIANADFWNNYLSIHDLYALYCLKQAWDDKKWQSNQRKSVIIIANAPIILLPTYNSCIPVETIIVTCLKDFFFFQVKM